MLVATLTLHPEMEFEDRCEEIKTEYGKMHKRAHCDCFVANALSCMIYAVLLELTFL